MKMVRCFLLVFIIQYCFLLNIYGQTITGTVISEIDKNPLPGVSIWIPHTNIGTITDYKGNYSITIDSTYNTLEFRFIGHDSQEVIIIKDTIVNITLEELPIDLNEIIIKSIYVRKRGNPKIAKIKKNGLFRKSKMINVGLPDTTFNRMEAERKRKILESVNIHKLNDSINFKENLSIAERDFRKYMIDSIDYPETAFNNNICGNIYARFTINEGRISDIKILRGRDPVLDNEVISVLQQMPNQIQMEFGKYAKLYNRQIPVKYIVCLRFRLIEM